MLHASYTQGVSAAVSSADVQIHVAFVREPQYSGTIVARQVNYVHCQFGSHNVLRETNRTAWCRYRVYSWLELTIITSLNCNAKRNRKQQHRFKTHFAEDSRAKQKTDVEGCSLHEP